MKIRLLVTSLVLAFFSLSAQEAGAQTPRESIGLTPAYVDAAVKSGSTYTQEFTLTNSTRARLKFRCKLNDYWYDESNKRLYGEPGTLPRSASTWVHFTPSELILDPGSSAVVKAIVSVPQAAAGGFYTMPVFEAELAEKPSAKLNEATASLIVQLGGLLLIATEGSSEYVVEILNGELSPPSATSELELKLDMRNRGTAHANLRGMLAILDSAGRVVGRGLIDEKRYLPGEREKLAARWAGDLGPGEYVALITLTYNRAGLEPETIAYDLPFTVK